MKLKNTLEKILILINLLLFGFGSFLCFIIAVTEGQDRFLISGVFLLLFTFCAIKVLHKINKEPHTIVNLSICSPKKTNPIKVENKSFVKSNGIMLVSLDELIDLVQK